MGHWKPENHRQLGPIEVWVPTPHLYTDTPGAVDWPADEDPLNPAFQLGILPAPCEVCVGKLIRYRRTIGAHTDAEYQYLVEQWKRRGREGPKPTLNLGYDVRKYDLWHIRTKHWPDPDRKEYDLKPVQEIRML